MTAALIVLLTLAPTTRNANQADFRVHAALPGLDYRNVSGSEPQLPIIEQNGQGVCLFDYDSDGRIDIFVTNAGTLEGHHKGRHAPNRLFRNRGSLRFEDATDKAGVAGNAWSNGCAAADYDDDGHMDLYVTNWGPNMLYRNNGDGTFADVTDEAAVADPTWSSSAAFADFNRDGRLDLYVSNYVRFEPDNVPHTEEDGSPCTYRGIRTGCGPWRYPGVRDTLYLQTADGRFTDATQSWGLDVTDTYRGMGLGPGDFDKDGDIDLFVGCDVMKNLFLRNNAGRQFQSIGTTHGGALNADGRHESGMGVAVADLFQRGELDVLVTNFAAETNTYYRNNDGRLEDRTRDIGFDRHAAELGWGTIVADFNQDGRLDIFVANGHIYPQVDRLDDPHDTYHQHPRLYLGTHAERLRERPPHAAFTPATSADHADGRPAAITDGTLRFSLRAAAAGDLDNDGDIDIVAVRHNGPLAVFENRSNRPAAVIRLRTRHGGLSPHGARIEAPGRYYHHWPNQGYQSSHDPRVFFAGNPPASATITWPDGTRQTYRIPASGRQATWRQRP